MKRVISIVTALAMFVTLAFMPAQLAMADTNEGNAAVNEQVIQQGDNEISLNGEGETDPVAVTGMTLSKSTASIIMGKTLKLTAKVEPTEATDKIPTWSSSNTKVATVDATGKVTAALAGTTTITATLNDTVSGQVFTDTCEVTVKPPTVAKVTGLKFVSSTTKTVKIKWSKATNAKSYEIWRARGSSKTYKKVATTSKLTFTDKSLATPSGYKYKVRGKLPYKTAEGETKDKYGTFSGIIYAATKPGKVYWKVTNKLTSNFPYVKASWNKKYCTGYIIRASQHEDFSNYKKYVVSSKDTTTNNLSGLKDGKKYYFKIRAYFKYNGKTTYGEWSSVKSKTVHTTGWKDSGIKKYYYKNGKPFHGEITLDGNPYYFNSKGILAGVNEKMAKKVKAANGKTKYTISVSREDCRICVLQKSGDDWVVIRYNKCTCGAAGTPSPYGTFKVLDKKSTFGKPDQYSVWNATRFVNKVYFHSVLYAWRSSSAVIDGRLGYHLSHGCIRLSMAESAWIYNNVAVGTKVVILK